MSWIVGFYKLIYPVAILILKVISPLHPKLSRFVHMRRKVSGQYPWTLPDMKGCILIHAASGEFEYAKPVIRELLERGHKVLVTYYSPSYKKQIEAFPGIQSCPLPWDSPRLMRQFLQTVLPQKILIARTDFWFHFLQEARNLKIPVFLFSAVLSSSSSKVRNPLLRRYYRSILAFIERIYCVSVDDQKNIEMAFHYSNVQAIGDTRYDQVQYRIQHPKALKNNLIFKNDEGETQKLGHVFLAGSTWPEDEEKVVKAAKTLISHSVRIVIAPHEPTASHLASLQARLTKQSVMSQLYSQSNHWAPDHALIIDQVGILADLYKWADWAFIGGSFKAKVHSVMEALAQGCYTFVGPYHTNNREALEFQRQIVTTHSKTIQMVQPFLKTQELIDAILATKKHEVIQDIKNQIQVEIQHRTGASRILCQSLFKN